MTTNQIITYGLCLILGVTFHTLLKYRSLKQQATSGNISFNLKTYAEQDWVGMVLSILSGAIWLMVFGEVVAQYPRLANFARLSFVGMGMIGSYLIQYAMSRASKKIQGIIDAKTNIADGSKSACTPITQTPTDGTPTPTPDAAT